MTEQAKHTPGPWRWEVNRKCKTVELVGGPRFGNTVVSFARYGMNNAAPKFWFWDEKLTWSGPPKRADDLAIPAKGREHHASWFSLIDHPDARLMAAAPELLAALNECREYFDNLADADCDQDGFIPNKEMRLLSEIDAALKLAGYQP